MCVCACTLVLIMLSSSRLLFTLVLFPFVGRLVSFSLLCLCVCPCTCACVCVCARCSCILFSLSLHLCLCLHRLEVERGYSETSAIQHPEFSCAEKKPLPHAQTRGQRIQTSTGPAPPLSSSLYPLPLRIQAHSADAALVCGRVQAHSASCVMCASAAA